MGPLDGASALSRCQETGDRFGDGIGPVEWEEVPTRVDDFNRAVPQLVLEGLGPGRLEELIVRTPENQCRRLDFIDVLRAAGEGAIVQRAGRAQIGTAPPP